VSDPVVILISDELANSAEDAVCANKNNSICCAFRDFNVQLGDQKEFGTTVAFKNSGEWPK